MSMWIAPALLVAFTIAQDGRVMLDNDYTHVTSNGAPCATASAACVDRVIVALGDIELRAGATTRKMTRGDIAVFAGHESYAPPSGGPYFEVVRKPDHPPVQLPREVILPEKNAIRHDGPRFFIFEERLEPGDTRTRHSHGQRVIVQLNHTQLQQWPDGEPELLRDIVPDGAAFSPPVIHVVKNVGDKPLRGIVIEFKR
ncbi:MAG TPA: hypothetical protein VNJ02_03265 [Vicinamibacterales bacterium]|nr:hypothetical protein [Vicinamibacterales bacterium]